MNPRLSTLGTRDGRHVREGPSEKTEPKGDDH